MKKLSKIERDLYAIEKTKNGKIIHIFGYSYMTDGDYEFPYRMVEFCFNFIPVGLSNEEFDVQYERNLSVCKQYIEDYSESDIEELLDTYFDKEPIELSYYDITEDTPCGVYIDT